MPSSDQSSDDMRIFAKEERTDPEDKVERNLFKKRPDVQAGHRMIYPYR